MPITLFGKGQKNPAQILEEGWLLYAKPTTLEPVGTLFRIDDSGRRFIVDQLNVQSQEGAEATAKVQLQVRAHIGFFARFLGLDSYSGTMSAQDAEQLEFEVIDPIRQVVTDAELDRALTPVLASLKYRADNRYFVIRDVRSATAMTYRLTQTQVGEIGGEASLAMALGAGVKLGAGTGGLYELNQTFPERMRVMFLAEEIAPVSAGLARQAPTLGRFAVRQPLVWTDG
jgi:hypothetical protein